MRTRTSGTAAQYLINKIETVFSLDSKEREALLKLPLAERKFRQGEAIVREGECTTQSFAVLDGVTAMIKLAGSGERHIVIFHFVSDIPDLHSLYLERLDVTIEAATACTVGFMPHRAVRAICDEFPRIRDVLWRATLVDAAILRENILNIAVRPALTRVAHLLCEFAIRLKLAKLGDTDIYDLPLTQSEIGDCLGISHVHVNRVLQNLRKKGLIDVTRDRVEIHDWTELQKIGDFDIHYLHLTKRQQEVLGIGVPA